jgi:hypothetical protein
MNGIKTIQNSWKKEAHEKKGCYFPSFHELARPIKDMSYTISYSGISSG